MTVDTLASILPLNTILHGDCVDHLRALPDRCVDLVFADPPYNLQLGGDLRRPNQSLVDAVDDAWDQFSSFADYDAFTRAWLTECRRVLKDTGAIWVIGSYHNIYRVGAALMDLGYWILNDCVWVKANPMPQFRGVRFTNATETLIWAKKSRDQKRYTFHYHAMKALNDGKQMQNVWRIPLCTGAERLRLPDGSKAHSTQKPEALLRRVILSSSSPGEVILDPFFGTGTTGAVAKKLGRYFIGIEADAGYVALAQARIDAITPAEIEDTSALAEDRRRLPRVSVGQLIAAGYLRAGQMLYSRDRTHQAALDARGRLMAGGDPRSIHQLASALLGVPNFNGWDYWFYEAESGMLESINALREQYRQGNGLNRHG
jgi:site-specific DNA-methyltransferase (adenine-specific)/modification methylase